MTAIKDKPGRRITLNVIVDHERKLVHIIRNISNTKGFLVNSGNMGWMTIDEWQAFLNNHLEQADSRGKTLFERFGGDVSK